MFGGSKERHKTQLDLVPGAKPADSVDSKGSAEVTLDPVSAAKPSDSVDSKRYAEVTPTVPAPFPVPRHLLEKLRNYPRLRDAVVAYLLVQDRIAKYEEILADLTKAGKSPESDFWDRLHKKLGAEGLRADFPGSLLADPQFESCVRAFDDEHVKAREAAAARINPFQSAESAPAVAYDAVRAILKAAESLAMSCKAEARSLLDELQEAVNKIFADEVQPPEPVGATDREKQLLGSAPEPDFQTHLLWKGEPYERHDDGTD